MIHIVDVLMGHGKSTGIKNYIKKHPEKRYLFIVETKEDMEEITTEMANFRFETPSDEKRKKKRDDIKKLLRQKKNVVSSHALFKEFDDETRRLIKEGGYTLVLDEVVDVLHVLPDVGEFEIKDLLKLGAIEIGDNSVVRWTAPDYRGRYVDVKQAISEGCDVEVVGEKMFVWTLPPDLFTVFNEAFVLTYMFESSWLYRYFKIHNIEFDLWTSEPCEDGYMVRPGQIEYKIDKNLIHVVDFDSSKLIGKSATALSVNWYKNHFDRKQFHDYLRNIFRNVMPDSTKDTRMYAVYGEYEKGLSNPDGGFANAFVAYNRRGTNKYRDRRHIVYMVNVYANPEYKRYFGEKNMVNNDKYALSTLIQFVWRSAIRDNKEIWVHVASPRMRDLFVDWLDKIGE